MRSYSTHLMTLKAGTHSMFYKKVHGTKNCLNFYETYDQEFIINSILNIMNS